MSTNDYHFITQWRVQNTCEEVSQVLGHAPDLVRWWPSVYLEVQTLAQGQPNGVGREIGLYTKGWLPYTLRWQFTVTEVNYPYGFSLVAKGDFVGRGIWTFEQDSQRGTAYTNINYDWKIEAEKPILKHLSFIMKPLFSANHHWAMRKGEESLNLELLRRQAKTAEERAGIAAPPPPTFAWAIKGYKPVLA